MEFSSIFHEPTSRFAYATEKNAFSIRIKTKKSDIKKIIFHSQDKYIPLDYIDSRLDMTRQELNKTETGTLSANMVDGGLVYKPIL